jgi:GMP synthase-like glutamine amidotransferase
MKTLLVDNGSTLTKKLALLSPGEEHIVSYQNIPADISDYSLILLSGSSLFPIQGNEVQLVKERRLITNAKIPVVGICFGHELIAETFGGKLLSLNEKVVGLTEVEVIQPHTMFDDTKQFTVYENHQYAVREVGEQLQVLAKTDNYAAVIKHKELPIYGFQFHPEHHTDEQLGDEIFLRLFEQLVQE